MQDAWLRLARLSPTEAAEIRDLRGWLTTVVGRLCLDRPPGCWPDYTPG